MNDKPDLLYPAIIMRDEAVALAGQLEFIKDEGFKKVTADRKSGCELAEKILKLYGTFQSEPLA